MSKPKTLAERLAEQVAARKKPCTICARSDREQIDEAYRIGKSTGQWGINQIALDLGLNWNTLKRHFTQDLGKQ